MSSYLCVYTYIYGVGVWLLSRYLSKPTVVVQMKQLLIASFSDKSSWEKLQRTFAQT